MDNYVMYSVVLLVVLVIVACIFFTKAKGDKKRNIECFNGAVPKVLHRTLLWDKEIPKDIFPLYDKFNKQNSGWEVKLWKSDDAYKLLDKYGFRELYDSYTVKVQKADFIRYLIIYDQGGCYCDFDIKCQEAGYKLDNIKDLHDKVPHTLTLVTEFCRGKMKNKEEFCSPRRIINRYRSDEPEYHRIANYFLMASPKSEPLWDLIKMTVDRASLKVKTQYDILYTTGPALVSTFCDKRKKNKKKNREKFDINIIHEKYVDHTSFGSWRDQVPRMKGKRTVTSG